MTGQWVRTGKSGLLLKDYKPTSSLTASIRPFRDGVFNISASKTSSDSFRTYSNTGKQFGEELTVQLLLRKSLYPRVAKHTGTSTEDLMKKYAQMHPAHTVKTVAQTHTELG